MTNKNPAQILDAYLFPGALAWKVLKDKMEDDGIVLDKISPKAVVRQAYNSKYIEDAETWLNMIGDRNLVNHTYDFSKFEVVIQAISSDYLPLLDAWYLELLAEINE